MKQQNCVLCIYQYITKGLLYFRMMQYYLTRLLQHKARTSILDDRMMHDASQEF